MKTIKFEVEIDLNTDKNLTDDELLSIANNIDTGIRRERNEWGILPDSVTFSNRGNTDGDVEAKLIRVKPI
jgi:hypothetical protein